MTSLIVLLLALLAIAAHLLSTGYVASHMWLWFLVPLGLPPITIAHAAGLSVFFTLFRLKYKPDSPRPANPVTHLLKSTLGLLLTTGLLYGIGWAVHLAM